MSDTNTLNQNSGGSSGSAGGSSVGGSGPNAGSGGGGITVIGPSGGGSGVSSGSSNAGSSSTGGNSASSSSGGSNSVNQATNQLIEQMQTPLNYFKAVDTSLVAMFLGAVAILMLFVMWKKLKRGANEASPPRYIKHKGHYYYRSLSTRHRKD